MCDCSINLSPSYSFLRNLLRKTCTTGTFISIKSFCTAEETISKTKRQLMEWEKIFANDISGKGLVLKIYKELRNSTHKKQPN